MTVQYLFRRLAQMFPTILVATALIFFVIHLTPGDPVLVILNDHFQRETYDALAARLGLDQPLWVQYWTYLTNLVQGHWGNSFRTNESVTQMIFEQFPYTLQLAVSSVVVAILVGVPAGLVSALKRNSWPDYSAMLGALVAVCMPSFWLGILLLIVFSVQLQWTPLLGAGDPKSLGDIAWHLVLPSIALGLRMAALIARITRASVLEIVNQDFVRTARAKGLRERTILLRHVARVALIPVITVIGLDMGHILGGSAVIEIVFSRPGVGRILLDALISRDYPVIQAGLVCLTGLILLTNLVVDILYGVADPRIRMA